MSETKITGAVLRSDDEQERKQAASTLGSVRGGRKAEAAKENGRLGGRPPGVKDSEETRALKSQRIREALARKKAAAAGGNSVTAAASEKEANNGTN